MESQGEAIEQEPVLRLLREKRRIRRCEEKAAEMYSLGKIRGFLHLYIGEEAVAVGVGRRLAEGCVYAADSRAQGQERED